MIFLCFIIAMIIIIPIFKRIFISWWHPIVSFYPSHLPCFVVCPRWSLLKLTSLFVFFSFLVASLFVPFCLPTSLKPCIILKPSVIQSCSISTSLRIFKFTCTFVFQRFLITCFPIPFSMSNHTQRTRSSSCSSLIQNFITLSFILFYPKFFSFLSFFKSQIIFNNNHWRNRTIILFGKFCHSISVYLIKMLSVPILLSFHKSSSHINSILLFKEIWINTINLTIINIKLVICKPRIVNVPAVFQWFWIGGRATFHEFCFCFILFRFFTTSFFSPKPKIFS